MRKVNKGPLSLLFGVIGSSVTAVFSQANRHSVGDVLYIMPAAFTFQDLFLVHNLGWVDPSNMHRCEIVPRIIGRQASVQATALPRLPYIIINTMKRPTYSSFTPKRGIVKIRRYGRKTIVLWQSKDPSSICMCLKQEKNNKRFQRSFQWGNGDQIIPSLSAMQV